MAINMKLVQQKLSGVNKKQNSDGGTLYWRPESGRNTIRIVPYKHNMEFPFIEVYQHYNFSRLIKSKILVSPKTIGKPDPIQEWADKLKQTGDKSDYELSKKFQPARRIYAPIIVRGKEEEGVKFYGFGVTIYEEILRILDDPDYGDITSIKNGRDVVVDYTPKEESSGKYPETKILVKPNITPAVSDANQLEKVKNQPNLVETLDIPSYDELKQKLDAFMNDEEEEVNTNDFDDITEENDPLYGNDNDDAEDSKEQNTKEDGDFESKLDNLFGE